MTRPREIDVHIEELVLHGFQPGDRRAIADAIDRAIARALATSDLLGTHDRRVPHIDGGQVASAGAAGAQRIGAAVARAVGGGLEP